MPRDPEPAELPVRIAARGIDVLFAGAAAVGLGLAMGFGFDWLGLAAALILSYFAGFDAAVGATPGKWLFGLRVLGPTGERPSLRQALVRESFMLLGAIPFAGPVLAVAAWLVLARSIRSSPLRQGRHDAIAGGTRVVRVARTDEAGA